MPEVIETEQKPVEQSFEQFVVERTAPKNEEPKKVEAEAADTVKNPPVAAETTGDSTSDKPKRDRTAEGRIAELNARAKALEAERDEWRTKWESTNRPKPVETPAEARPDSSTGKPLLKDFVAALKGDETYEDAQERWEDAKAEWRQQSAKKTEAEQATAQEREKLHARVKTKYEELQAKYEDFDAVIESPWLPAALKPAAVQLVSEFDNAYEVLYYLAKDPDEVKRISALSPARQLTELGKMEDRLTKPAQVAKPPVSKAPPPVRDVTGGGSAGTDDPLEPGISHAEFVRRRQKHLKK